MRSLRMWSAAVAVVVVFATLLTPAAAAQSPEPTGGDAPVYLPVVGAGPNNAPAQQPEPVAPEPVAPEPVDTPPDPGPIEPEPVAPEAPAKAPEPVVEQPVVADNPDAAQWDVTDAAVASPLGTEAVDWNVVGNFTVSNNLGVGRQPPALLGDFYRSLNSAQQVRVTNTSAGGSASAALAAVTNIGGTILEVYGNGHIGVWDGISIRNWTRLAVGSTLNGLIVTTNGADPLVFGTNNQEQMRINSSGFVGINTTAPSHRLTVQGATADVLRLIGPGSYGLGARLDFGDSNLVYISEPADDDMEIRGTDEINLSTARLEVNGVQPVLIRRLENVNYQVNTGIADSVYDCVVASWSTYYDLQEDDAGPEWMWAFVSGGTWWVRADFRWHIDPSYPDVDLLCFRDTMVEWQGASRALADAD